MDQQEIARVPAAIRARAVAANAVAGVDRAKAVAPAKGMAVAPPVVGDPVAVGPLVVAVVPRESNQCDRQSWRSRQRALGQRFRDMPNR